MTGGRFTAVVGLTLIWVLLGGTASWSNLVGGVLVSLALVTVFPLPAVHLPGPLRPAGLARLGLRFAGDLVVASLQVAVAAVRRRPVTGAVIAVPLRVVTDVNTTLTSVVVSLVPGSVVVEADRDTGLLLVHLLDGGDPDRSRREILAVEERVVRAIGSDDELRQVAS